MQQRQCMLCHCLEAGQQQLLYISCIADQAAAAAAVADTSVDFDLCETLTLWQRQRFVADQLCHCLEAGQQQLRHVSRV
jgi:hypothetical protein